MRNLNTLAILLLSLAVAACSSIETRPADTTKFAAANFTYFTWRSQPLTNTSQSGDLLYVMDPIVRREVTAALTAKGYVLDPERAQFNVDYLQAMGLREGVSSQDASGGIDPIPSVRPNRQINQAMVDNANALAGVQTTSNIAIQFNLSLCGIDFLLRLFCLYTFLLIGRSTNGHFNQVSYLFFVYNFFSHFF